MGKKKRAARAAARAADDDETGDDDVDAILREMQLATSNCDEGASHPSTRIGESRRNRPDTVTKPT